MKVLLINGSPHTDGTTNFALEIISKTLISHDIKTDIIQIGTRPIGGCIGCNACLKTNRCFMNDIVNEILDKVKEYDGFVFGSPVHFANASGNMVSLLDRLFYGRKNLFQGKVCTSVASARRAGTISTIDQLNKYALMSNMYIVGSSYWNIIYGTNKEEAKKDLEAIETLENLAENMAYLLKCLELGKQIPKPNIKTTAKTNFIR